MINPRLLLPGALVASLLGVSTGVSAQDTTIELVDTGITNHSTHGTGYEMRFRVEGINFKDIPV